MPKPTPPTDGLLRTLQDALSACRLLFVTPGDDEPTPAPVELRVPHRQLVWDVRGRKERQRQISVLAEARLDI